MTTDGTKLLSVMKSPAMILREPTLEPGACSLTQPSSVGYVAITRSFRDSVGCVQMYFRSSVRLIPVTKKPPEIEETQGYVVMSQGDRYVLSSAFVKTFEVMRKITWSAVLFPAFKLFNKSLSFALVGPPVRDMWPQVAVRAGNIVFIGHNHLVAQRPQFSKS